MEILESLESELNVDKFVENRVVMPGDDLTEWILPITSKIRIGQGISHRSGCLGGHRDWDQGH